MARPMSLNGGAKQTFPRHISDGLLDLRSLRIEIEQAEGLAEDTAQTLAVRRRWRSYRDLLEEALDVRIELMQRSTESHERAISGRATLTCRRYEACDPTHLDLCVMAQKRIATSGVSTGGEAV